MTLTQRLTRAGATFIILGTAAALVPTNGSAFSDTGNCAPPPAAKAYVGTYPTDTTSLFNLSSSSMALTAYPAGKATVSSVSDSYPHDGNTFLTTTYSAPKVTTALTYHGSKAKAMNDTVTVTFSDHQVVTYTVAFAGTVK